MYKKYDVVIGTFQAKEEEGSATPVEESESGCCGACVTCFCAIGFLSWAFL